ncbi:class I SAM-dependent methyltransferase [Streptomyces sp. PTY087I2]|uniref:class I SAM-dependent methyltransferase n=1 Tax=Streptomyces sp. PTY087I2 TaxID=1819298 RepID=UPI00080BDBFD|nr:class I SAM-dependent methyltransferase [Streptomyces sp. PTY087I2]OCC09976.1 Malonyl-[acyl-carrier protein] O-methyltransferase [Streptomyces sp. PTY087I2]
MIDVIDVTDGTASATTPFDDAERRIWSGRAEAYARTYARLCAYPAPALLDAAEAGPGTRVLDVGCGTGTVSAAAVARGASVYAADADPGMVAATRRAVPGVTPHIARLPELPYANDTFDAAVGNFVLNHVGRPLTALTELRRITRPGGRIAVTIWRSPGAPGQTLIGRAAQAVGLTRPAWLPALAPEDDFPRTKEGLAALLDAAGLLGAECSEVAWEHRCDPGTWWAGAEQGIGAIGQVLNSGGAEGLAAARRAYDGLSAEFRTRDGLLALPHVALLAHGRA